MQQNKAYQMHVLSDLLQLQQLDGQAVTNPGQPGAVLSADTIRAGATLWHSDTGMLACCLRVSTPLLQRRLAPSLL